jgi:ATP-binding cassette subfamily B protein
VTSGAGPAQQSALPTPPAAATTSTGSRGDTWRSLLSLRPYVAPHARPLILSGAAALLATIAGLMIPLVVERLVNDLGGHASGRRIASLALVVAGLGAAEALLVLMRRRIIAFPTTQVEKQMRTDIYAHLQKLGMTFHDRYQSGQLLSRAFSDLSAIRRFVAFGGIYLVVNGLTIVVGAVILTVLSPPLGLVVVAMTIPMFALSFLYESRFRVVARRSQDQVGDLATLVEESVLGIRVLKSFGRGRLMARRFSDDAAELRRTEIKKVDIISAIWATIIALPELALGAILVIGAVEVSHHTIGVGTLVAAVTAMTYLIWPIESIGFLLADANNCATAADRFWEVLRTEPTITDAPVDQLRHLPDPVRGELRFEDVHFSYPLGEDSARTARAPGPSGHGAGGPGAGGPGAGGPDTTEILRGIDLTVRPGETLALVGLSGSGKTTLTALVPRLYDVTSGRITLDGVDLRELSLDELRSQVSTAFEEPVLFSASVRENVALGLGEVPDQVVEQALAIASATDFTARLPWGLDTRIGEQGLSLSGGQRQRLALARAVAGEPAVLVLDDPLSALDVHTEAEVEGALRRVLHGVTALVVAHRPSTVSLADRVALIADGRVAAIGRHSDLMATSAEYRNVLSSLDEEDLAAHGDTPAGTAPMTGVIR